MQEKVNDIMTKNVIALLPSDTIEEAAKLMSEHDIGSLPVVSGGELKGIVTDRDIVLRCVAAGKPPSKVRVADLMTTDIAFTTPNQTVYDAINLMSVEKVRRLPVINNGYVDGIISLADIARIHSGPEISSALSEISEANIGPSMAVRIR